MCFPIAIYFYQRVLKELERENNTKRWTVRNPQIRKGNHNKHTETKEL